MSPETFYQQQLGNVGGGSQQTSLLLEIKGEEEQEMWNQGLLEKPGILTFTSSKIWC